MTQIIFIDPTGTHHTVDATPGDSVMQAAVKALVPGIEASCGGNCICATCHCHIDERWLARLTTPDTLESEMLACTNEVQPNSRLTCQVPVSEALDGMVVHVAASQH